MNEPYLGQTTDMVLGQEFLTWLWFRSETQPMDCHYLQTIRLFQ